MNSNLYTASIAERIDILSSDSTMQRVATHHIYEYEKGIRYMVLCTLSESDCAQILPKLEARQIAYYAKPTPKGENINLFFGRAACIEVVRGFLKEQDLHELNDEQDFILGAMLGYDICMQCERYHGRKAPLPAEATA